jgi:DNA primase
MGTALTERQVRILKKLSAQIVLALDADAAGTEAAVRGHDVVRESAAEDGSTPVVSWRGLVGYQGTTDVDLRVAVVPQGKDPDDFIRGDPDGWRALIEEARPVLEFRLEVAAAAHDLGDPRGRSQLVQEFLPLLGAVTDPVVRAHYLQRLSRLAQVSEDELTSLVARRRGRGEAPERRRPAQTAPARQTPDREGFLLALLLQYPHLREEGLGVAEDLLWEAESHQIYHVWRENVDIEAVRSTLEIELMDYFERLILWKLPLSSEKEASEALRDCVKRLNRRRLEAEQQAMSAQVADLQDEYGSSAITSAIADGRVAEEFPELEERLQHGVKVSNELHKRERRDGLHAVETAVDG